MKNDKHIRIPTPLFITSLTASVAFWTSGKCMTATVVGSTGVNRIVTVKPLVYGAQNMIETTAHLL